MGRGAALLTDSAPACQNASIRRNAGMSKATKKPTMRVKATFRLDVDNITALEVERLRRIAAGIKRSETDLSDLVNEAIRRTFRGGRVAHA